MVRIYQPRQRESDKRWDMTVSSDEEGWCHAIGYCGEKPVDPSTQTHLPVHEVNSQGWYRDREPFLDKYHRDGHATAQEADACWKEYQLDVELSFHDVVDEARMCALCTRWTQRVAVIGHEFSERIWLCEGHANRAGVEFALREAQAGEASDQ